MAGVTDILISRAKC